MTTKDRSDRPSHELGDFSPTGTGEPHRDHSTSDPELPCGHRQESSGDGTVSEPLPKLGFMQAIKAAKRARRRQAGHARVARPRRDPRRKAHSLIDKVYRWENLYAAWRSVRANKGKHGLDRVTIRHFEADLETHLREIQRKLMERRYVPKPVLRVYIPKASDPKQRRPLGIPVVADRIVQQAIFQIVDPIFDPEMSERSFGFRKGRKAHHAIATAIEDAKAGYRYVVDADIRSFFDEIGHDVVMSCVRRRIADGRVLTLFEAFLSAGVMEDGKLAVSSVGVPQGGVISPWLSNLVLDDLDKALEAKGYRHVRYADDFVVLCRSPEQARQALDYVKEVLEKLRLTLHETKTRLTDFWEGFEFLGHRFRRHHVGISPKAIERLKTKIRMLTQRQQGRNVNAVLGDLNPVIRGWARYFGMGEVKRTMTSLDCWIRMRVRAFRFKRKCHNDNWRLPNKRLEKWGLLSLQTCRPSSRLPYIRANGLLESGARLLEMRKPRGVAQCVNGTC